MRVIIVNSAAAVVLLSICFGIFNLGIIHGRHYKYLSDKNCVRLLPQEGSRGRIFDREGNCLADNYLSYDVMILPQGKNQTDNALGAISLVTGKNVKELQAKFKKSYIGSFIPVTVLENIDTPKAIILGELKFDYPQIIIQPKPLRRYPYGNLACHVIGYLNEIDYWRLTKLKSYGYKTKDIVGCGGVEEKYDYYLRQETGALSMEVDHRGRFTRMLGFRQAQNGKDIWLTLDLKAQRIAEDSILEMRGGVILLDPHSGEIIAMASRPDFSPAIFINKSNSDILNIADSAFINRAISGVYPPASLFKLISSIAGLETGKINLSTVYNCTGATSIGRRSFRCWDTHHGQDLAKAIAHSCDIFFYRTGILLGPQVIHDYALKFGLSKLTGIDLPYETPGLVPDPLWKRINKFQGWFDGDTANLVIGQGALLVTPIQMAGLMAVFANNGKLVAPYIIKNIGGKDMSIYQKKETPITIKKDVINYIRQDLKGVVSEPGGTANVLSDLTVSVAGKTGTAQVAHNQTHGWFAGFFPFNNPRFVICVFLENNSSGYAASVLAKKIIARMIEEKLL